MQCGPGIATNAEPELSHCTNQTKTISLPVVKSVVTISPSSSFIYKGIRKRNLSYFKKRNQCKKQISISSISSSKDIRPYVVVEIAGITFKALLDSGANISVLGRDCEIFLEKVGIKFHHFPTALSTANGERVRIIGYIHTTITFNSKTKMLTLYLAPSLEQKVYLGMDFWKLFDIVPLSLNEISTEFGKNEIQNTNMHELTESQKRELENVKQLFPSFAEKGLGRTDLLCHKIDVGNSLPIKQRYYPVSPAVQRDLYEELDRMISLDVVEESESSWSSPVTIVKKANGKNRLCLDARKLNAVTVKDAYPLPIIEGLLSRLDKTYFISTIDLKDAFWQIPLDPASKDKTAFTIPGRPLYHFKVMPFGLCNAPQTMSRLMHKVIPSSLHEGVFVYLDDLLITSASFEDHIKLLITIANCLTHAKLTINLEKSKFMLKETKYLGHIIGNGCLKVDDSKIAAIAAYTQPKNVRQVRRFLGICGWYRRFIQNFSTVAAPLTEVLKKNKKFVWEKEQQSAFENLKLALTTAPVLAHPNFNRPFYIQCDASKTGIGSVLFQKDNEGMEHPIAFISQKLNSSQRNYSITELECLAAVISIEKFRQYIEGFDFTVITDHASLKWLMDQKDLSGRLARWSLKLQSYNFHIEYRKGSQNVVPDALSRQFCVETLNQIDKSSLPHVTVDLNSSAFIEDDYLEILNKIKTDPSNYENYRILDHKIYVRLWSHGVSDLTDISCWKLLVPKSLRSSLVLLAHDPPMSAHLGIAKTKDILQREYFWPHMIRDIRKHILNCDTCKCCKPFNYLARPPMQGFIEIQRPWQYLYIDFLGPYPRSTNRNTYLFIVLDKYSKYILLQPMPDATASRVSNFLEEKVFKVFSVPESIMSDNGRQFISKIFKDLLNKYGVRHVLTPKYSPQSNSSERVNRSILAAIRGYINENHSNWDKYLVDIQFALVNTIHSSTGFSPHFLVYGQHLISNASKYNLLRDINQLEDNCATVLSKEDKLNLVQEVVLKKLKEAYERSQHTYNLRSRPRQLQIGQVVFVRNFVKSSSPEKFNSKLTPKFVKGILKRAVGKVAFEVTNEMGKSLGIYHLKDIKI